MASETGWTPVRRGDVYCSPKCGGGCTFSAYSTANRKAKALASKLGSGWVPEVWENLGWHFLVRKGILEMYVYPGSLRASYKCFCQSNPQVISRSHPSPEAALEDLGTQMRDRFVEQHAAFVALVDAYRTVLPKEKLPQSLKLLTAPPESEASK